MNEEKEGFEEILTRGVDKIISKESLLERLKSGKNLRIKLGVDPSSTDLHLGHTVVLRIMKKLQDLGHTIIFLIGDYTALVGDPSGKNKTRPVLTADEIENNAKTYLEQVGKIVDIEKTEIRKNSEWFSEFGIQDFINLGSKFSVASIIERDDFESRLKNNKEIYMHELYYPMMQAYDSVMLEADAEFGGSDQTFNMLAGRSLQKKMGQKPQEVLMAKILIGTDGKEKMSKSLGNYIGVTDSPKEMFGKVMSIRDELILNYFLLCTDVSKIDIEKYKNEMSSGQNPRDYKEKLAYELVKMYHNEDEATLAKSGFVEQFRKGSVPKDIEEVELSGTMALPLLLVNIGAAPSTSQAWKLIEQGAVRVDGAKLTDPKAEVATKSGMTIQVGKLNWWKIR